MRSRFELKTIICILLTAIALGRVQPALATERAETVSPETSDSSRRTQFSVYSETYPFFFPAPTIEYQRLRAEIFPLNVPLWGFNLTPYVDLLNEKFAFGSTSLSVEAGFEHSFDPQSRVMISVKRFDYNNTENNKWQFRLGYALGRIHEWSNHLFLEGYSESFLINPNHLTGVMTFEGWGKFGWRAYERHHIIIDPIIAEARTYQNTRHTIGGADYVALTLGPRVTFWLSQPNVSLSAFGGRSRDDSSMPIERDQWWGILAIGAYF